MKLLKYTFSFLLFALLALFLWFVIPYSPLKTKFNEEVNHMLSANCQTKIYDKEDFKDLPMPILKYLDQAGYFGSKYTDVVRLSFKDADFRMDQDKPPLRIDYTVVSSGEGKARLALIETSMMGIPFQGIDSFINEEGRMRGALGKVVTLFDQKGSAMDQGSYLTYLAESLFFPHALLNDKIKLEQVNDYEVKMITNFQGKDLSGIYKFNQDYEFIEFYTNDRPRVDDQGRVENLAWSAHCSDYIQMANGVKYPSKYQVIWHGKQGDFTYFDGRLTSVENVIQ